MNQSAMIHRILAEVIENRPLPGDQYLLRLHAPKLAPRIKPGHFAHLDCGPEFTVPRPFSFLDADPQAGHVDMLYKVVGRGTEVMRHWQKGREVALIAPVGNQFDLPEKHQKPLLLAGGIGLAPMLYLGRYLKASGFEPTLMYGTETESPFETGLATLPLSSGTTGHSSDALEATLMDAEKSGITNRLSSLNARPGWFHGFVTQLATQWLQSLPEQERNTLYIYTCGPTPMMAAAAKVAEQFSLKGQASLEEHMACGFGGCAGCVAPIGTADNWKHRRVCVDGPVFPLDQVRW
ncbi:MAG: dihydroorotate dehydrogenase electron transfer subunit [Magnetococcales bacterium]|nr:dihydroorotate dehydrogenase electron transfer subunit [Magnetococcales bacterium]